jgi:inorganic pyrophosphatase
MFRMTDEAGGDDKVLCVPANDPRLEHLRDIHHVPSSTGSRSSTSSRSTRTSSRASRVEGATWVGRAEAEAEIDASRERHDHHEAELDSAIEDASH